MSPDVRTLARDERADLAAFLDGLPDERWDEPTLCDGWRVRDVVAHLSGYEELRIRDVLARMARCRFRLDALNALRLAEQAAHGPDDLRAQLHRNLRPSGLTRAFGGRVALLDAMVHHQDIRRPLGMPRTVPPERLRVALDFARIAPPLGNPWRVRGLRLRATDLDWAAGRGPVVEGAGEAVLMAAAGRAAALDELTGPGRDVLAGRMPRDQ